MVLLSPPPPIENKDFRQPPAAPPARCKTHRAMTGRARDVGFRGEPVQPRPFPWYYMLVPQLSSVAQEPRGRSKIKTDTAHTRTRKGTGRRPSDIDTDRQRRKKKTEALPPPTPHEEVSNQESTAPAPSGPNTSFSVTTATHNSRSRQRSRRHVSNDQDAGNSQQVQATIKMSATIKRVRRLSSRRLGLQPGLLHPVPVSNKHHVRNDRNHQSLTNDHHASNGKKNTFLKRN